MSLLHLFGVRYVSSARHDPVQLRLSSFQMQDACATEYPSPDRELNEADIVKPQPGFDPNLQTRL
ncbi:uncharacterized protein N7473_013030 [Penicillium subrubescens]|uniref:uncharacterized protein n=1 Tax=Penicillium subrubescens TaxID=1316194 RepID=UPI0025452416|nr:uncharacterized protein N7473_013030 [Penicillium subrubescens]KAJ5875683.1 hypothetical protein N7473_013030 [Penicillium subrubescens]